VQMGVAVEGDVAARDDLVAPLPMAASARGSRHRRGGAQDLPWGSVLRVISGLGSHLRVILRLTATSRRLLIVNTTKTDHAKTDARAWQSSTCDLNHWGRDQTAKRGRGARLRKGSAHTGFKSGELRAGLGALKC
jgi:hypothetical protein